MCIRDSITDSAFSFEEGMALADKHPDLLLADIGLADGSGIEICRMVRGKTPVIFLTAKDGEEDMLLSLIHIFPPKFLQRIAPCRFEQSY